MVRQKPPTLGPCHWLPSLIIDAAIGDNCNVSWALSWLFYILERLLYVLYTRFANRTIFSCFSSVRCNEAMPGASRPCISTPPCFEKTFRRHFQGRLDFQADTLDSRSHGLSFVLLLGLVNLSLSNFWTQRTNFAFLKGRNVQSKSLQYIHNTS